MEKPIEVIFLPLAERFVGSVEPKARKKLFQGIRKTKERLKGEWFSKMKGSDGIFEFRFDENGKFYRLFAFWDNEGEIETLIAGTHGIVKKTNKTPKDEIRKAERIKREYFEEKNLEDKRSRNKGK